MFTSRLRSAALAAACAAVFTAGCGLDALRGSEGSGSDTDGEAGAQEAPAEVEGVRNFYGEFTDFPSTFAALENGEASEEDLEHPWVAQRDHVDAAADWDGSLPEYETTPPAGGDHLSQWHTCTGTVYDTPLADGSAVHSLEHGAVWLSYDPELVDETQIASLAQKIQGRDYSLMSPYPGQGVAVSLQSWGNQYRTDDPADPVVDEYLDVYILNEAYTPEPNATCAGGVPAFPE